jgi:NADH-quinone oxidoreductase subunit K
MPTLSLNMVLALSGALFGLGLMGLFLGRKSLIQLLIAIELLLLAVNINFIAFSSTLKDLVGQIFSLFILTVAAAEAAIGLAILVLYHRRKDNVSIDDMGGLHG